MRAYFATCHATHAVVIERTGKAVKTHRALRIACGRLARDEAQRLGQGAKCEAIADYEAGGGR